jgi:hypothetical protein
VSRPARHVTIIAYYRALFTGDASPRGAYLSWLAYYTGVLEPAFMSKFMNVEVPRGTAGWVAVE